jgi:hypothetical protein
MPKPNPPGDMIPIHVMLTAAVVGGDVVFTPKSPIWDHKKKKYVFNKIRQGMAKNDYHQIIFKLVKDDTGLNLRLPQDENDAFWVIKHTGGGAPRCPDHTDSSDYSEFNPIRRADDKTLVVENYNEHLQPWVFSLNFVKREADGSYNDNNKAGYVRYDPIGDNQDFSQPFSQAVALVIAGAVGGCLLTLGAEALL